MREILNTKKKKNIVLRLLFLSIFSHSERAIAVAVATKFKDKQKFKEFFLSSSFDEIVGYKLRATFFFVFALR